MSHAMHRTISPNRDDFVIHVRSAKGVNRHGSGEKIKTIMKQLLPLGPVAFGNPGDGCTLRDPENSVLENFKDGSNLHVTFASMDSFKQALQLIQALDTGLSVCVAGPLDQLLDIARDQNLSPDSMLLDLGPLGAELNFNQTALDIVSLCGHMRVSPLMVDEVRRHVHNGEMTVKEASSLLGKPCRCGCFNSKAAGDLIEEDA